MSLNCLSKYQMKVALNCFLSSNFYLSCDDIKQFKILKYDDLSYELSKSYAVDYIKQLIPRVKIIGFYDRYFDDSYEEAHEYCWDELFDLELDKLSNFALIMSEKRQNEVNIFEVIEYILSSFIDFLYEEVLNEWP